jgi:hypothetical protein
MTSEPPGGSTINPAQERILACPEQGRRIAVPARPGPGLRATWRSLLR